MARALYFCFTSFAPTMREDIVDPVAYMVYQREISPTTNAEHWQGYLEFKTRVRVQQVKAFLQDNAAHIEKRRGSSEQASLYCKKADTRKPGTEPIELGIRTEQTAGKRNDLEEIKEKIDLGIEEAAIADEHFGSWCRHYKAFERYKRIKTAARDWETKVFVVCGETGVGKSRTARELYPNAYWKPRSNWWCGYTGQKVVIIDDFYGWLSWDLLLRLCDRYPLDVETKGGSVAFVAETIVITSNKDYSEWYKPEIDKAPLTRRIARYTWIPAGQIVTPAMIS